MEKILIAFLNHSFINTLFSPIMIDSILNDILKGEYKISYDKTDIGYLVNIGNICVIDFYLTPNGYINKISVIN